MAKKELSFTGKKIQELRHEAGLSQGKLVQRFNDLHILDHKKIQITLTDHAVSNWENGRNRVDSRYIEGFSQIFSRPVYELLFDADELIKPIKLCLNMYLDKLKNINFREYSNYSAYEFNYFFPDLSAEKRKIMNNNIEAIFGLVGEFNIDTYFLINDFKFLKTPPSIKFVQNNLKTEAYEHLDNIKETIYELAKEKETSEILPFNGDDPFDVCISHIMRHLASTQSLMPFFVDFSNVSGNYISFLKFMASCGLEGSSSTNSCYSSLKKDENGDHFDYIGQQIPKYRVYYDATFNKIILETKYQLQENLREASRLCQEEDWKKITKSLSKVNDRAKGLKNIEDIGLLRKALHEAYVTEKDNS
ncbi:MAG: helix-turn-helix transcriptional regulator [Oenococcus sp.]|uniref:helix-turn-helix domain-containing protein n=1 Tax=Oenococcus sp. TaxID=1979414 RepID=UPI0039EC02D1